MAPLPPPPAQSVGFCTSADGVRIAYARLGEGPPLVVSTCWLSHLEYDLQSPVWQHFVRGLGEVSSTVRYDERGFGLSDWDVTDFSFEARLNDLEAVVDAAGVERFALLGMSQGGPVAVAYAHRHPERVTRLALLGSYVAMVDDGSEESRQLEETFTKMIEVGWARPEGRFRRVFTDALMPGATPEQMTWVDELMRRSTTAENAVAFRQARMDVDVSGLLPLLDVPTLVMHSRGDQMNPLEGGRRLAAEIPGAQLVTLETDNHVLLDGEPATEVFFAALADFLAPDAAAPTGVPVQLPRQSGVLDPTAITQLTGREREVLDLVAAGRENREIAEALTLSVRTVERHLQTVYRKLGLTGSAQRAAATALVLGADDYARAATAGG
jgi:pimeloyl-ACP methyl ester carboxylesterase/DNA-binding CsgD family transcriptional regulator